MPTLTPATASSGTATFAVSNAAPLYCSDVSLVCSDDLSCADNGATAATTSTGTLVHA